MNYKSILYVPLAAAATLSPATASYQDLPDDFVNGLSTQIQIGMIQQHAPAAVPQDPDDFVLTPEERAFIDAPVEAHHDDFRLTPEEEALINEQVDNTIHIGLSEEEQMMLFEALKTTVSIGPKPSEANNNNAAGPQPNPNRLNTRGRQDLVYEQALRQDLKKARMDEFGVQLVQVAEEAASQAALINETQAQKEKLEEERANHQQRLDQVGGQNPRIQAQIDQLTPQIHKLNQQIADQKSIWESLQQRLEALMYEIGKLENN